MTSLNDEYRQRLRKAGLEGSHEWRDLPANDASTWLAIGRAMQPSEPDEALWCFKTAMDLDSCCYAACEAAGDVMASRSEHLKAIGYYAFAYSPSLLNAHAMERMAEQWRLAGMHDFYYENAYQFARRIRRRRVANDYDHELHDDVIAYLRASGVIATAPASRTANFASAAAYDVYRLPDGRRNPTKGPNRTFHATFSPGPADIVLALRRVLLPLFEDDEDELLGIPIVAATDVFHAFPLVVLHPTRGPVIVVPLGTFGGLFAVNEILVLAQTGAAEGREYLQESIVTLRTFLTGSGEVDRFRELMPLVIRPELDPLLNREVWKRTVIQQTFMMLHEYGHIALGHVVPSRRTRSFASFFGRGAGNDVLWFPGTSDHEVAADEWAARHLLGGIPGVEFAKGGVSYIDWEIKEFFALLGLLRLTGGAIDGLRAGALTRWSNVAKFISLLHMSAPDAMARQDQEAFSDAVTYLSRSVEHPSLRTVEEMRQRAGYKQ